MDKSCLLMSLQLHLQRHWCQKHTDYSIQNQRLLFNNRQLNICPLQKLKSMIRSKSLE